MESERPAPARRAVVRFLTPEEGGRSTGPESGSRSQLEIGEVMTSCELTWASDQLLALGEEVEMVVRLLIPERFAESFPTLRHARFFEGSKLVGEGTFIDCR